MNSGKIYLSREEQIFLMEMLEQDDPVVATEKFAEIMTEQGASPLELERYLKRIMMAFDKKYGA